MVAQKTWTLHPLPPRCRHGGKARTKSEGSPNWFLDLFDYDPNDEPAPTAPRPNSMKSKQGQKPKCTTISCAAFSTPTRGKPVDSTPHHTPNGTKALPCSPWKHIPPYSAPFCLPNGHIYEGNLESGTLAMSPYEPFEEVSRKKHCIGPTKKSRKPGKDFPSCKSGKVERSLYGVSQPYSRQTKESSPSQALFGLL